MGSLGERFAAKIEDIAEKVEQFTEDAIDTIQDISANLPTVELSSFDDTREGKILKFTVKVATTSVIYPILAKLLSENSVDLLGIFQQLSSMLPS